MNWRELCNYPIIQAPMAGGATTPELVAAVSNAGALGSLAGALLAPLEIIEQAEHIRRLTQRPFAINLFVQPRPQVDDAALQAARELMQPLCAELGWETLATPTRWCEDFEAQFEALLIARPAVASFTFDILHASQIEKLQRAGIRVIGTATHLQEAVAWQALGADAICLQGVEAGGHRATFIGAQTAAVLGTAELLQACLPHISTPLIAAGGIMDGRDVAASLAAGAAMVQIGTAFLTTDEAAIHPAYKQALLDAQPGSTRQTRAFSGRLARVLENRFVDHFDRVAERFPEFPVQNALTLSIRKHAAKAGDSGLMALWAGQEVARCRALPVSRLIETVVSEWKQAQG